MTSGHISWAFSSVQHPLPFNGAKLMTDILHHIAVPVKAFSPYTHILIKSHEFRYNPMEKMV